MLMKVMKFGGTSVGSAERIKEVAELIKSEKETIVVLSAMSGTTNELVNIANHLYKKEHKQAIEAINQLESTYGKVKEELISQSDLNEQVGEMISLHFSRLKAYTQDLFTIYEERAILAIGELLSTALLHYYLQEINIPATLLPALNFMRIDKDAEPDYYYIQENLNRELEQSEHKKLFITQGFICRNVFGEIDNLKRGGSDYTASIIGSVLKAEEIQIWTDIDGFHNNDPRYVENTKAISHLSFEEAAELAYFGAKILHPASVQPAKKWNIPVRLKNTMQPTAEGTLLSNDSSGEGIKAIAAKDNITVIKIKSGRMLLAFGFLRKVFEIFETYKTSIDVITTSEVAVSVTIDNNEHIEDIVGDLEKFGSVTVEHAHTIICIVGDFISESKGYAIQIFEALKEIPIRMISFGGSKYNISILIDSSYKEQALKILHEKLF